MMGFLDWVALAAGIAAVIIITLSFFIDELDHRRRDWWRDPEDDPFDDDLK